MTQGKSISDQLVYSTVKIIGRTKGGAEISGTAFFYSLASSDEGQLLVLVTNKHVVAEVDEAKVLFHESAGKSSSLPDTFIEYNFVRFERQWISHPDPDVDLCVLPIGPTIKHLESEGVSVYYVYLSREQTAASNYLSELSAIEDIVMVGYPTGLWDSVHNMPICRQGITATPPRLDYEDRPEFMIDAACFPGSSGSPVFLYNIGHYTDKSGNTIPRHRFKLLGVLYAGPQWGFQSELEILPAPVVDRPVSITSMPINLGLVIKAHTLFGFDGILSPNKSAPLTE